MANEKCEEAKTAFTNLVQPDPEFCICDKKSKKESRCSNCVGKKRASKANVEKQDTTNCDLKQKLEECIRKFDTSSEDMMESLKRLKEYIRRKELDNEECFPKKEWPHCPTMEGPESYQVPHPYLPKMVMYSKPIMEKIVPKVTLDGRPAAMATRRFYHTEPPMNVPPWVLPRYKSQELRGGMLYQGCHCWRKNGLQDDCPRWDCAGRPECLVRPRPVCPAAMNPPICGVRKPNLFHGKPPTCVKSVPPPPFPAIDVLALDPPRVPEAPSVPCPLHL